MIARVQYGVALTPNDRQCAGLCNQRICNVSRNRAVDQSCRMCNIDMKLPEMKKREKYSLAIQSIHVISKKKITGKKIICLELEFCGLKYLFSFFHNVPVTLNKINNSVRCGHTFWRRASCDTHALNIPWMTLNAFGPNSLKYSLKCSQEAFIICVLDVFVLYFFSFYFIKQFTLEYCVAKKKTKKIVDDLLFLYLSLEMQKLAFG